MSDGAMLLLMETTLDPLLLIDINTVLAGFIECGLWATYADEDDERGENLDDFAEPEDVTSESVAEMRAECESFVDANLNDLLACLPLHYAKGDSWSYSGQIGHDLWLTRGGHGAGFWDRGYGEIGDRLTEACRPYGDVNLWADEDGKVHYGF